MESVVKLVFFGETLEGFRVDDVKRSFAKLLKVDESLQATIFSGARVVLKRSVAAAEVHRYVTHLASIGARLHVEPDVSGVESPSLPAPSLAPPIAPPIAPSITPNLATPLTTPPAPPPTSLPAPTLGAAPSEEEIVCPNCGERQSNRILCRSCATDMPMGIAAKLAAEREAQAVRLAGGATRGPATGDDGMPALTEAPSAWAFGLSSGFSGRMARLPYATAGFTLLVAAVLLLQFVLRQPSAMRMGVFGACMLAVLFMGVRLSVLRCHDCSRSGWWTLLALVPYIGLVAGVLLGVVPGTPGGNKHGEPPKAGSRLLAPLALGALCLSLAMGWSSGVSTLERGLPGSAVDPVALGPTALAESLPSAEAKAAFKNDYASAPLHKAFAVSLSGSWGLKSGAASIDAAISAALASCEINRKPNTPPCQLVIVNGP